MSFGVKRGSILIPEMFMRVSKRPIRSTLAHPISEPLRNMKMFQVELDRVPMAIHQTVRRSQTVTRLGFDRRVRHWTRNCPN